MDGWVERVRAGKPKAKSFSNMVFCGLPAEGVAQNWGGLPTSSDPDLGWVFPPE